MVRASGSTRTHPFGISARPTRRAADADDRRPVAVLWSGVGFLESGYQQHPRSQPVPVIAAAPSTRKIASSAKLTPAALGGL